MSLFQESHNLGNIDKVHVKCIMQRRQAIVVLEIDVGTLINEHLDNEQSAMSTNETRP